MPLPLERDAGHQLEGRGLSLLVRLPQQLMDGVPGDAGGHGTVGQGEHLVLGLPLPLFPLLFLELSLPLAVGPLLCVLLLVLFGIDQVFVLLGVVDPEHGGGGPAPQAVHGFLQLFPGSQRGDLPFPAVVHDPDLIDVDGLGAFAGAAGVMFLPAEHAPDPGDGGDFISQHPLLAYAQLAEPLAVGFQVPVHHGEKLLHRRRLVRVRELVTNGLGQGALLRCQGVPQAPVGQEQAHQDSSCSRHGDQVVAKAHLFF